MNHYRYELKTQDDAGTHRREIVVDAPDLNIGFVKAAIEALAELAENEELVSLTFWTAEN